MTWLHTPEGKLRVGKVLGLVRNYRAHAEEFGHEVPAEPVFFLKPATSIIRDGGRVLVPRMVSDLQAEAELAVVIGSDAIRVPEKSAYEHVLGYAAFLDITARDLQQQASSHGMPWTLAKGMDTFGPISSVKQGDHIQDPHALEIVLKVNGTVRQRASTGMMVHKIPRIISAISAHMTLERGDVIATGTPEGVPEVRHGDVLEAEIHGVGRVRVDVQAAGG